METRRILRCLDLQQGILCNCLTIANSRCFKDAASRWDAGLFESSKPLRPSSGRNFIPATDELSGQARKSLFDVPVLSWLIHYLDAIPIERDGMGIGGIKETLRRLKRGESVLIFPEGTRTADGRLQPLKPGFYAIAKRSKCPILPVAVAGAYQMWPRDRSFPGIGRVAVSVGDPISAEAIREMSEAELIEELTHRIRDCFAEATQIARIKA